MNSAIAIDHAVVPIRIIQVFMYVLQVYSTLTCMYINFVCNRLATNIFKGKLLPMG